MRLVYLFARTLGQFCTAAAQVCRVVSRANRRKSPVGRPISYPFPNSGRLAALFHFLGERAAQQHTCVAFSTKARRVAY